MGSEIAAALTQGTAAAWTQGLFVAAVWIHAVPGAQLEQRQEAAAAAWVLQTATAKRVSYSTVAKDCSIRDIKDLAGGCNSSVTGGFCSKKSAVQQQLLA